MIQIRIDEEFRKLIPPLTADEYEGLKASILAEGCRDAIVVWREPRTDTLDEDGDLVSGYYEDPVIVDGHNRYKICTEYGIPFKTVEMDFNDRDEAMLWMIDLQRGRRNLSKPDSILLAQKKTAILAARARMKVSETTRESNIRRANPSFVNTDKTEKTEPPIDVRKETAKLAGVSTGTLAQFEQIQRKKPELIDDIRKGEMSINQAYNTVKLEEKKETIKQAERKIAEQAKDDVKPVLRIGDGIGFNPAEPYDLLLTDPPYSTDVDDIAEFADSWLYDALRGVKPSGFAYVFIGAYPEELKAYLTAGIPPHMKLEQVLVWTYKNTLGNNPKDRYKQNWQACLFFRGIAAPALDCPLTTEQWAVQEINAPDGRQGDRYHAWQKPIEIAERFIRHSTKPGDTVFDPFACTGTFLLAASKLGRKGYGFEINPENAEIAFKRGCVHG